MPDVFISYAREDRARVRALADACSAHGWSVWWDREIKPGKRFAQVIADALAGARCVVVVWSRSSVASDWVREEAEEGRRRGVLIPVLIDDARPPLGFGAIQAVDLQGWDGSAGAEPFQGLIAGMAEILGPPSGHDQARNVPPTPRDVSPDPGDAAEPDTRIDDAPAIPSGEPLGQSRRQSFGSSTAKWAVAAACLVAAGVGWYKLIGNRADPPAPPATQVILKLDAVLAAGSKPLGRDVRFDVHEAATAADGKRKSVGSETGGPVQFRLPVGRYRVTASYGSASSPMDVEVAAGDQAIQRTLNLNAGILRLSAVLGAEAKPLEKSVRFDVHEAAADADGKRKFVASDTGGPGRFPVSAGRYRVTATYGSASSPMDVDVAAGDDNVQRTLNLNAGILRLSAVLAAGGKPLEKGVRFDVHEAAVDADGKRKPVVSDTGGPGRFPVSAGRYRVTATYGSASSPMDVDVAAGDDNVQRTLNLNAGILRLSAVLAAGGKPLEKGVRFDVHEAAVDAEGKRKPVVSDTGGQPRFPLSAGRYHVTARSDSGSASIEVTISAGQERPYELRLGAAKPAK